MLKETDEITIEQIRAFIDANKERADVAEYITSLEVEKPLNVETVSAYLGTVEGKNLIQPIIDRANTGAIKTYSDNQKPIVAAQIKAGINEELIKLNPQETPEQRQIRELNANQAEMKAQWEREKLENAIAMEAAKNGIPLELATGIPYPSIDHFKNVSLIWEQVKAKEVDKLVNERLASAPKPNGKQESEGGDPTKGMNSAQKFNYYKQQAEQRDAGIAS
jgi:hypothetical protein